MQPRRAHEEASSRVVPLPGARVKIRMSRGRLATRPGRVIDVQVSDGVPSGTVITVRWDDDRSVASLVPGHDVEVICT